MMKRTVSPLQQSFHRKAALIVSDPIMLVNRGIKVDQLYRENAVPSGLARS